jgi:fatty acid kinase fatty acid binding subunit
MPNKVAIVTDSTAYLPEECLKQYNISVTPVSVIWGEQIYLDGVDFLSSEFYTRLVDSKVMPTPPGQTCRTAEQVSIFNLKCLCATL